MHGVCRVNATDTSQTCFDKTKNVEARTTHASLMLADVNTDTIKEALPGDYEAFL